MFDKNKMWKEIKSLAIILFVVMGIRSSFFEPFHIPSGSMIPNLYIGDFVLVNKLSYGFKVPFTDYFSTPTYITKFTNPKRGDIIVFRYPRDPSISYIKRVIGLPGDTIEIINKRVSVNGVALPYESFMPTDGNVDKSFREKSLNFYKSKATNGTEVKEYVMQDTNGSSPVDNMSKMTVPYDSFFCMGDNRDFSADSRYWGFVPKENIRGKAMFVWFSFKSPLLDEVGPSEYKLQLFRIGQTLW